MGERALGPQIGDAGSLLQRTRGRDDLPEHGGHGGTRERARVRTTKCGDEVALPSGVKDADSLGPLESSDLAHQARPLVELAQNGAVHRIDVAAKLIQAVVGVGLGHRRDRFSRGSAEVRVRRLRLTALTP
jgi:hypothetical protein